MKTTVLLGSLAMLFLTGCDPKRFDIVVPTSAIDQARQGGVGYAKAKLEYTFFDDDVKSKLSQIKSVVLKYCKDGEADWSEDDFQTVFRVRGKIPVGDEGAIADAAPISGKSINNLGVWSEKGISAPEDSMHAANVRRSVLEYRI